MEKSEHIWSKSIFYNGEDYKSDGIYNIRLGWQNFQNCYFLNSNKIIAFSLIFKPSFLSPGFVLNLCMFF